MKRQHLIAILAAVTVALVVMIGAPALLILKWRETRELAREEMELKVHVVAPDGIDKKSGLQEIVIDIDSKGRFIVGGKVTSEEELLRRLTAIAELNLDQPIRLRSSGDTSWNTMVDTINIVERSGLWNISFATQKSVCE